MGCWAGCLPCPASSTSALAWPSSSPAAFTPPHCFSLQCLAPGAKVSKPGDPRGPPEGGVPGKRRRGSRLVKMLLGRGEGPGKGREPKNVTLGWKGFEIIQSPGFAQEHRRGATCRRCTGYKETSLPLEGGERRRRAESPGSQGRP